MVISFYTYFLLGKLCLLSPILSLNSPLPQCLLLCICCIRNEQRSCPGSLWATERWRELQMGEVSDESLSNQKWNESPPQTHVNPCLLQSVWPHPRCHHHCRGATCTPVLALCGGSYFPWEIQAQQFNTLPPGPTHLCFSTESRETVIETVHSSIRYQLFWLWQFWWLSVSFLQAETWWFCPSFFTVA